MTLTNSSTITVRMNKELKQQAEKQLDEMGLTMSTAVTLFIKAVVREGRIPFEITTDPFYSKENLAHLRRAVDQLNQGKGAAHALSEDADAENLDG